MYPFQSHLVSVTSREKTFRPATFSASVEKKSQPGINAITAKIAFSILLRIKLILN